VFRTKSPFEYKVGDFYNLSSFSEIGYHKTYEAHFNGIENLFKCKREKKLELFNKSWEIIHSINEWRERSSSSLKDFEANCNRLNERRNDAIEEHRKLIDRLISSVNGKNIPQPIAEYIHEVDEIHINWQNTEDRTRPDILHRRLVLPLRILNRKNTEIPLAIRMNDNLMKVTMEYQNQSNLLRSYKKQFFRYYALFNAYSKQINLVSRGIKKACT
jgi:hypothetical protein